MIIRISSSIKNGVMRMMAMLVAAANQCGLIAQIQICKFFDMIWMIIWFRIEISKKS